MYLPFEDVYLPTVVEKRQLKDKNVVKNLIKNESKYVDRSIKYDMLSIHIDRINITPFFESNRKSQKQITDTSGILDLTTSPSKKTIKYTTDGKMSEQTKRKIQKAIKYLNFLTVPKKMQNKVTGKDFNFKLCFATLTLSSAQCHSDTVLKNSLINQLLVELKKRYKIENYVWKLEKQSNGNAHFHFIFDKFLPHTELRELWNRIQNKLGYVDKYTEKMASLSFAEYALLYSGNSKKSINDIRNAYKKGKASGWQYPNSTDVHSLQFINDIDSYLIKYMSKDEQNKGIEGRLWGCSQKLSKIDGARAIVDSKLSTELNILVNDGCVRHVKGDYYEIIFLDWFVLERCNCSLIMSLLRDYLITHFDLKKDDS